MKENVQMDQPKGVFPMKLCEGASKKKRCWKRVRVEGSVSRRRTVLSGQRARLMDYSGSLSG